MRKQYLVRYEKGAQKALKKMDKFQASLILSWIEKNLINTDNPRQYGKGLVANRSGEWRYRVGNYRIIADIDDEVITILIVQIGHRNDIYK
ncbi:MULTISPECIES: type II toxin-antitoxin system RelE family toxin [Enterococcus]|uniref:Addiction module toxin RelE n=1 Tax=Enterococcus mundtii TaxID=53346 RepID=A0A1V2UHY6_ENTMU|nr:MULTISPECIES: type II toxin-antitoxin system RelE/ParE family toxin [Enterococcus]EOH65699.1 plasmid stabilization protein [Enterococcus mundtii ATCC 882]EOU13783.1 plasmid stabilization protein [Enterococcus mundtii ATCC 882]MBE9910219.1 type II toxin-antitoxin system RelE/ParE family toxin [Enterococcus mundtii]MRI74912.1 type II toxin-antitoxin system RelE/ParE family toxin [Enterococcus mundtii]ONN42600.1 addiction module toxin RelE [Enterococcus mundtii]